MTTRLVFTVAISLLLWALPISAHEGATGIVKERMEAMETMGKLMKAMGRKIEINRNLASIKVDADKIGDAAQRIPDWFPIASNQPPSDAKPEIWPRWDEFQAMARRLQAASTALATAAASGEPKEIASQFKAVGSTCSACHDAFRAKR
jgi:cytochrome c556